MSPKLKQKLLLVAILLLAFTLRITAIDQIPAGLSHDEAYNGVTAIQVLKGQRVVFFEINKGIEPLIIYLEAVAFYLFGIGIVQLRLVNIFSGLLTVALLYPLTVRLFNNRVALLAVAALSLSFWAVFVSRLTLRAVTLPPLLILTLYLLWHALDRKSSASLKWFALSGTVAGITMYTYLSSRFVPMLVVAIFGWQVIRRRTTRFHWAGLLLFFLIWAIIFAPLGNYYLEHIDSFSRRANQVTTIPHALNGEFTPMLTNSIKTLGMFTFHGDETDRYNLDGRPVFDWLNGFFFYIGLVVALFHLFRSSKKEVAAMLLLLWTFFMLLPDFITDDSPHFLRTVGTLPVVYILWALGIEQAGKISARFKYLAVVLLLLTATHTTYDYFYRWAESPDARYIYGADIAEISNYLKDNPNQDLTVISAEYYRDLDTFRFNLQFQGQPPFVVWFDGSQTLAFPPTESGIIPRYLYPSSAPPDDMFLPFLQYSEAESGSNYDLYQLLNKDALQKIWANSFSDGYKINITINDDLLLLNYQLLGEIKSGGKLEFLVGWQALRTLPPGTDYTFLIRLYDSQDRLWSEADGNGYMPDMWQPGVMALQLLTLRLPGDLPPSLYHLTLEVVDRQKRQALPTTNGETIIPLGTVGKISPY